jgi:hypothetical protein
MGRAVKKSNLSYITSVVDSSSAAKHPSLAITLLRKFCKFASCFYFFWDLAKIFFIQSKVVSLASNSQPGGPGPCIYVPPIKG